MAWKGWAYGLASLVLSGLALLFTSEAVAGQAVTTGTVVVQATDGTGAVLPGVTLTLLDVDTGVVRTAIVEQSGSALFLNVPVANNYELTAELQGFTTRKIERIKVDPGATRNFKIVLDVGGVAETVTVQAEVQLVDTKSAAPRETMDSKLAESAPLMARNQAELASLFPAVLQTTADNSPTFVQFHVRGQATTGHGYRQDGADTMTPYLGRTGSTLSPASIERIEFVSGGMPPEYGEQPGGVFNIVTKSGTNKIAGAYSFLYRDDRFNSKVVSGIPSQVLDSTPGDTHFEEAIFGAPLKRDKAFLFVTYQFRGEDVGNILSRSIRTGDHHNIHSKINIAQNPSNQWVIQTDVNTVRQDNTNLSSTVSPESQGGQDVNIMFGSVTQTHQFNPTTVLESQATLHPTLQVLNLTNKVNVLSVQSVFTAPGQPTRVDTGRQVQVGVDVRF